MNRLTLLKNRSTPFWITTNILLVVLLGLTDYQTGNEYSFSLFYLLPIFLISWYVGRVAGTFVSILSAFTWLLADVLAGEDYAHPIIYFWNSLMRFGFFIVVTYLVSELHKTQKSVENLARTDFITGAVNSRYFQELLGMELARFSRHARPFTLVYLDIDNFKQVNDQFGHESGDLLIKFIVDELKFSVRKTDIVARLGGDEFAIIFPETGQAEARVVVSKLQTRLASNLETKYPFVTFSAGVVTYLTRPASTIETIRIADELMYSVKNTTKNDVRYAIHQDQPINMPLKSDRPMF